MNRVKILALASVVALGLSASALAAVCPGPDTFGHRCTENPPGECTFLPTSTVAFTSASGSYDDSCTTVTLPFTFMFYGQPVTFVGLNTNGQMGMNQCNYNYFNDCLPSIYLDNSVYGVWDDLYIYSGYGGTITYGTSGAAPNRIFAATWHVNFIGWPSQWADFQIKLYENGGDGEKVVVSILRADQSDYTTGIEHPFGIDFLQRSCNSGGTFCTEFSGAPPPTGGGDCDLSPIEAKLDDEFRFTDDDELLELRDEVNGQLAALEAKLDDLTTAVCDVVRLLHTPSGIREADCGGQHYDWNDDGTLHD